MRNTIILITIVNIILTGCGNELGKKKSIMVFIDYTKSAAAIDNYNSDRIKGIVENVSQGLRR